MNKPVNCRCGGKAVIENHQLYEEQIEDMFIVRCTKCDIQTSPEYKKDEAIYIWNRAMGALLPEGDPQKNDRCEYSNTTERTAKVEDIQVEWGDDEYVNDRMGAMYHYGNCGNCGETVSHNQKYCHECGSRLEWK